MTCAESSVGSEKRGGGREECSWVECQYLITKSLNVHHVFHTDFCAHGYDSCILQMGLLLFLQGDA